MSEPTAYDYVPTSVSDATPGMCPHCGYGHTGTCPRIKAVEYHQDGTVKRVEYHSWGDGYVEGPRHTLPSVSPVSDDLRSKTT